MWQVSDKYGKLHGNPYQELHQAIDYANGVALHEYGNERVILRSITNQRVVLLIDNTIAYLITKGGEAAALS